MKYILFTSITYANMAGEYLAKQGFKLKVSKTPSKYTSRSCGYSVQLLTGTIELAVEHLNYARIKFMKTVVDND